MTGKTLFGHRRACARRRERSTSRRGPRVVVLSLLPKLLEQGVNLLVCQRAEHRHVTPANRARSRVDAPPPAPILVAHIFLDTLGINENENSPPFVKSGLPRYPSASIRTRDNTMVLATHLASRDFRQGTWKAAQIGRPCVLFEPPKWRGMRPILPRCR